jgi:hypothetical protein
MAKDSTGKYDMSDERPSVYKLAIVHKDERETERLMSELGIKGAYPLPYGKAVAGKGFEKIVVLSSPLLQMQPVQAQAWLDQIQCRLIPSGKLVLLF